MSNIKYACYHQKSSERDLTDDNFSKGIIRIKWNQSSTIRWNPYKSFMKMRIRLSLPNDNPLSIINEIAPTMFFGHNFWSQIHLKCHGKMISHLSDYVSQCSALKERYLKSETRKNALKEMNFPQSNIHDRINIISSDGIEEKEEIVLLGSAAETLSSNFGREIAAEMGYDVLNQFSVAVNTGVVTFAVNGGAALPDPRLVWSLGEIFVYRNQASNILRHGVVIETNPATITIRQDQGILVSALQTVVQGLLSKVTNIYSRIVGIGTDFQNDLVVGDELLIEDNNGETIKTKVCSIDSATEIKVNPAIKPIFNISNWSRIRKKKTRRIKDFEICFKPSIGLFDLDEWLPGDWELCLFPHISSKFQKYVIESLNNDKTPGVDYKVEVKDLQLYLWQSEMNNSGNGIKVYRHNELKCQSQTIVTTNLTNKTFIVNPKSHSFTLAFQKLDAGLVTTYPKSKFICNNNDHLKLIRFQFRNALTNLPIPTPSIEYNNTLNKDYTSQHYYENQMYLGSFFLDDFENLEIWQERGPYYSIKLKNQNEMTSRLTISTQFEELSESISLLLFEHFQEECKFKIDNGEVTEILSN